MSLPVTDLHLVRTDSFLLSPKSKWQQFFSAHKKWVPNQFSCFDTHLNVLRYPMDLTSFSLDFVSIWSFSCSLRRLFPKVYIFCSHIDHCISLFDTFSSYLEGFQIIFFRSITRFCVFPLFRIFQIWKMERDLCVRWTVPPLLRIF